MPTRLLLIQSLLLAIFFTWPAALHPASAALGSPNGDGLKHVWNLWWMHRELWSGPWGLRTTLINYPAGIDLYPIEVANGLLTAWLPIPPVLAANLLAVLHVFLVGLCTGWLGWLVTGERRGALAAAAVAQGSAFTAFTMHAGIGELRQAWWVPFGLACAVCAHRDRRARDFVRVGLVVAASTLACFYHGFFLATAVGVFAVVEARLQRRLWLGWAGAAALSLLVVVPTITLFASTYGAAATAPSEGFWAWMSDGFPKDSYPVTSLRFLELFTPDATPSGDSLAPFEAYLGGRYFGVLALVLGVVGAWALGRGALPWLGIAAVGVTLALGNLTYWGGEGGTPLLMPLSPMNRALSYFAEPLNFPVRYLSITTTALAVLVAASTRFRWAWYAMPLVLADVLVNDRVTFPRSTFRLEGVADVEAPPGAVAELSWVLKTGASSQGRVPGVLFDSEDRARSISAQLHLDRPMETIPIERVDGWATDGIDWVAANGLARVVQGAEVERDELETHLALLWRRGFRSVLLTHDCLGRGDLAAIARIDEVLGDHKEGDCLSLWTLAEPGPLAGAEAIEAAYAARLAAGPATSTGPPVNDPEGATRVGTGPGPNPGPPSGPVLDH